MNPAPKCPSCGKPLAPNAPQGLCQECLLKAGFPTGTDAAGPSPRFVPPGIEELAGKFPQLDILELIGQGGMGAIYKARQKQLNRFVALKILPPGIGGDPAFAERFTREAQALAQLNHPGIVTLYEFGQADGLFYFLMEYMDGINLRQVLAASRLTPKEALAIVPQICDALQYAHERGIVHRDIKPENILLNKEGQVKIADFGVAKIVAQGLDEITTTTTVPAQVGELTETGSALGTPQYMAPEQIKNSAEVDNRADIYSLGVVFYQMLTGELPSDKIEPPSRKVLIDVRLDEVVLRALEKEPDRRYQQVGQVKTDVETISRPKSKLKPKLSMKKLIVLLSIIAILSISLVYEIVQNHKITQSLNKPGRNQPAMNSQQKALFNKFVQRMAQDRNKYTPQQLEEEESLMRAADKGWGSPQITNTLQTMITKYPDSDRAGCAMLYLAQISQGDERAKYLQDCIDEYNDCFYGDGVQVGAYARYLLAQDYRQNGDTAKADALSAEIKSKYPNAIDHGGNLLVDSLSPGSN